LKKVGSIIKSLKIFVNQINKIIIERRGTIFRGVTKMNLIIGEGRFSSFKKLVLDLSILWGLAKEDRIILFSITRN
jgi:hypothetical protein